MQPGKKLGTERQDQKMLPQNSGTAHPLTPSTAFSPASTEYQERVKALRTQQGVRQSQ